MRRFLYLVLITGFCGCVTTRPAERRVSVDRISPLRVYPRATVWLFEQEGEAVRPPVPVRDLRVLPDSAHWRRLDGTRGAARTPLVHAFEVEERQAVAGFAEGAITGVIVVVVIAAGFLAAGERDCRRAGPDADSCGWQALGAFAAVPVAALMPLVGLLNGASTKRTVRYVLNEAPRL